MLFTLKKLLKILIVRIVISGLVVIMFWFCTNLLNFIFNFNLAETSNEFDILFKNNTYEMDVTKLIAGEFFSCFKIFSEIFYKSTHLEKSKANPLQDLIYQAKWSYPTFCETRYSRFNPNYEAIYWLHSIEINVTRFEYMFLELTLGYNWDRKPLFNGQLFTVKPDFLWVDRKLTHPVIVELYDMWEKIYVDDVSSPFNNRVCDPYIFYKFIEKQIFWDLHDFILNSTFYKITEKPILYFFESNKDFIQLNSNVNSPDDLFFDLSAATVYYTAEPNFKYFIPYPYVASGNYVHHDYWWIHITMYYYWLWFFFIFLILFFLISFAWEVEHNITKDNPQRETRGVSRSKCGDLITAIIPISWATAIIIHESTDAIDNFDGFGTLEFVVGIRAYQWGWEYYYPNSLKNNITNSNDKNLLIGKNNLFVNATNESISKENNNNLILNKKQDYNILPIFAITNSKLNKEIFNINKMTNFGFSKLCIYNAYKFALNSKAIDYSNILSTDVNLTNFNSKKFINQYYSNSSDLDSNITQSKIALLSTKLKLFKKMYNCSDIKFSKTFKLSDFNFQSKFKYTNYYNFLFKNNYAWTIVKSNIISTNVLANPKVIQTNYEDFININSLIYSKFQTNSFTNTINQMNLKNTLMCFTLFKEKRFLTNNLLNLNNTKLSYLLKNLNLEQLIDKKFKLNQMYNNCNFFKINYYGDLSFRRIDSSELLEDMYWDFYIPDSSYSNQYALSLDLYKSNEYLFKYYGHYEKDKELTINNLFITTYWYKNYINLYANNATNSLFNLKYNYKQIPLFLKIYNYLDNSFLTNKAISEIFYKNQLNILTNLNNFSNFINSTLLMSALQKSNQYSVISYSKNKNFIFDNLSYKINTNFVISDNLKVLASTINSLWKTYKTNIYDNRFYFSKINLNFNYFDNLSLTSKANDLNKIINKNVTFFFNCLNFNKIHYKYTNSINNKIFLNNNVVSFDLPFSVASESDSFKYHWIDWYIPYTKRESKFIDITQYNLNGSKLFFNKYDYYYNDVNELTLSDNYYTRLISNKKNYINSYNYTPFLLYKNNMNFSSYKLSNIITNFDKTTKVHKWNLLLNYMKTFDSSVSLNFNKINVFLSLNDFFSNNKNFFYSLNDYNNYYSYISLLNNILLRRNFLMKQLFFNNLNFNNFNNYNTTIKNNIIIEWKSTLIGNDKIEKSINKNFIENFFKNNYELTKFKALMSRIIVSTGINYNLKYSSLGYLSNLIEEIFQNSKLSFIFDFDKINSSKKYQYNHMKKSVTNMLRLQPSKAICLPTDTKIQILAWSKDIIHSWAIPSAGIKIDCIPGYSSHKVFNITLSGVYYGQCMEICGRFHHWMPIVVYFLKRDLFLLWCLNVLYNKKINYLNNNKKLKNTSNLSILN